MNDQLREPVATRQSTVTTAGLALSNATASAAARLTNEPMRCAVAPYRVPIAPELERLWSGPAYITDMTALNTGMNNFGLGVLYPARNGAQ